MRQHIAFVDTRCRRCQEQPVQRSRLCEPCEDEYSTRSASLPLTAWRALGFALVIPLILLSWTAPPPFLPAMAWGHAWLIMFAGFAGWYLSKSVTLARLLLFRHRFENEEILADETQIKGQL